MHNLTFRLRRSESERDVIARRLSTGRDGLPSKRQAVQDAVAIVRKAARV